MEQSEQYLVNKKLGAKTRKCQILVCLKGIPQELVQHKIELNTSIPLTHQARYRLNPNCVITIKQDIGVSVRMNGSNLIDTNILRSLRKKKE
jgi:hypothetical protein